MDLTTIEKPFGMLDRDTQEALLRKYHAGVPMQVYRGSRGWIEKQRGGDLYEDWTYRVRPTPKAPAIELPWEVIDPRWKWAAMDRDGSVFFYETEPGCHGMETMWNFDGPGNCAEAGILAGIRINVTDWKQSLTKRPE